MGCSGLPGLHVTIGASVVLNLYALRDLCSVSVAARDINLLFKELALLAFHHSLVRPSWMFAPLLERPCFVFLCCRILVFPKETPTLINLQQNTA